MVGIGVRDAFVDADDDQILDRRDGVDDLFDFQTDGGQAFGDFVNARVRVQKIFQPAQREFHLLFPPVMLKPDPVEGMSKGTNP